MKSVILDTNALLRLLLNDIPEQAAITQQAIESANKNNQDVIVSPIVIFEAIYALTKHYGISKDEVCKGIRKMFSVEGLIIEEKKVLLTTLNFYHTLNLSFTDCFLLAKAQEENGELFTFDQKLKKYTKSS